MYWKAIFHWRKFSELNIYMFNLKIIFKNFSIMRRHLSIILSQIQSIFNISVVAVPFSRLHFSLKKKLLNYSSLSDRIWVAGATIYHYPFLANHISSGEYHTFSQWINNSSLQLNTAHKARIRRNASIRLILVPNKYLAIIRQSIVIEWKVLVLYKSV